MTLPFATILEYEKYSNKLLKSITASRHSIPAIKEVLFGLEVRYFLIENDYTDRDHLVDYTSFFARCHQEYKRNCLRVHFFTSLDGNDSIFLSELFNNPEIGVIDVKKINRLQDLYSGFLVVKHLKEKPLIGRTCLKIYKEKKGRFYPATRNYDVNLYGIPLKVRTMAFQEQDGTTGVCASIALWSAFQITGIKFQHSIPSPSEITKMALSNSPHMRVAQGFDEKLIANSISQVGLTPRIYTTEKEQLVYTKEKIYAYLMAGFPIIAIINIFDNAGLPLENVDTHAVTLNGYSFEKLEKGHFKNLKEFSEYERFKEKKYIHRSHQITRMYAHDDQLCPFSRIVFSPFSDYPITYWKKQNKISGKNIINYRLCEIRHLIIPLSEKIRITYEDILTQLKLLGVYNFITTSEKNQWDIFISSGVDFKNDILFYRGNILPLKEKLVRKSLPKFIWRAIARKQDGEKLFELVFDTTDSYKAGITHFWIIYDEKMIDTFKEKKQFHYETIQ